MPKNPDMFKDATKAVVEEGYKPPTISNHVMKEEIGYRNKPKQMPIPLTMPEMLATANDVLGAWPRCVDGMPFIDEGERGLHMFDRNVTSALFGWMHDVCKVEWYSSGNFITKDEFISELVRTSQRYDSVEAFPHEPMIPGVYYRPYETKPGKGKHLKQLLDRFNFETTADREKAKGMLMTPLWGGKPGKRPIFTITADEGRGVGKTSLAEAVARLWGGSINISPSDKIEVIKARLLSPGCRTLRVVLCDNIKTRNLSWADFEALVTTDTISGKQMYFGENRRLNFLTYIITLNAASLSDDMAQRSLIIKLVKGKYDGSWKSDTERLIDTQRSEIIGDLIAALRVTRNPITEYSRRSEWDEDILRRLENPDEIQKLNTERQLEVNSDAEIAETLQDFFAAQLERFNSDPLTSQVWITTARLAQWYNEALGVREHTISASKAVRQLINEKKLPRIYADKHRKLGRCFVWTGEKSDVKAEIETDLEDRIEAFGK